MEEVFKLLGQPHVLRLLHELTANKGERLRFMELESRLGLSPKTLAQRLRLLVEAGFLTRHAFNEIPPRVEYEATPKALELEEAFLVLGKWAGKNSMTATPTVSVVGRLPHRSISIPAA